MSKRIRGKIFVTNSLNSSLKDNSDYVPFEEEEIKTYRLTKKNSKSFELYEMRRKKPPIKVITIRRRKKEKIESAINRIRSGTIQIKSKSVESREVYRTVKINVKGEDKYFTDKNEILGTVTTIQTNYIPRNKILKQMVCLINVTDIKRNISDNFVGYSSMRRLIWKDSGLHKVMTDECIKVAIGKFSSIYGISKKSYEDILTNVLSTRYQFRKRSTKYLRDKYKNYRLNNKKYGTV